MFYSIVCSKISIRTVKKLSHDDYANYIMISGIYFVNKSHVKFLISRFCEITESVGVG